MAAYLSQHSNDSTHSDSLSLNLDNYDNLESAGSKDNPARAQPEPNCIDALKGPEKVNVPYPSEGSYTLSFPELKEDSNTISSSDSASSSLSQSSVRLDGNAAQPLTADNKKFDIQNGVTTDDSKDTINNLRLERPIKTTNSEKLASSTAALPENATEENQQLSQIDDVLVTVHSVPAKESSQLNSPNDDAEAGPYIPMEEITPSMLLCIGELAVDFYCNSPCKTYMNSK